MVAQDTKKKVMVECSTLKGTLIPPPLTFRQHYRRANVKNARAGTYGVKL